MVHYLALRITRPWSACDTFDKLKDLLDTPLKKILDDWHMITAFEISKDQVLHTHSFIITHLSEPTFRKRLKVNLDLNGNKDFSLSEVRDAQRYINYTVKCGDYRVSTNFPTELLQAIQPWVFPEELTDKFEQELSQLELQYMSSNVNDIDFLEEVLTLYSKTKRKIFIAQIRAWWLGLANRRNAPLDDAMEQQNIWTLPIRRRLALSIATLR